MRGLLNYNIAAFESDNYYGFPQISRYTGHVDFCNWLDFDSAVKYKNSSESGLHFFDCDYKLNRLWEYPQRYISVLSRYKYVLQPDFSLYFDFPVALQIYNKYRNHWLSAYYSVHGIDIIPNISPTRPDLYSWSFDGYPCSSVVAFSDVGCKRDKSDYKILMQGYEEMIKRLNPTQILYFTRSKSAAPSEATVIQIPFLKGG